MNNFLISIDKYPIFIFLIICFQYLQAINLNSFKTEFLLQLIPYLLILDFQIINRRFLYFIKENFKYLLVFNLLSILSIFWTSDLKYTIASNLELILNSITIILVVFYIKSDKDGFNKIAFISLLAIYLMLLVGIFSFNPSGDRSYLGISISLFSSILNYGSVCSLYLYHKSNKNYYLISTAFLFIFVFQLSSIRGVLSILIGLLSYTKFFDFSRNIDFYKSLLFRLFILGTFLIVVIYFINLPSNFVYYFNHGKLRIISQFFINIKYFKIALIDILSKNSLDLSSSSYSGERVIASLIGIKETILQSPIIGFGYGNSKFIFTSYGKATYSHNGFVDIFMGTGILGLFSYLKFLLKIIIKPVNQFNRDLIKWKRFSTSIFLVHFLVGLPVENIPLALLISLIISA